jgi:aminoglycoside phosphotransferase (APT) family kinase protein
MLASLVAIEAWEEVADHGDFGPHNLLCDGDKITGLVDWDRAVIQDCSKVIGTAVAEVLGMTIAIGDRATLAHKLMRSYADAHGCTANECRLRALPHALTRTLDWLLYQKAAPAKVHEESLKELLAWRAEVT